MVKYDFFNSVFEGIGELASVRTEILIPLNSNGLCDAEIIIPASALYLPTR